MRITVAGGVSPAQGAWVPIRGAATCTPAGQLRPFRPDLRIPSVSCMTVIEVSDLHKRYGDRVAVHAVSFSVDAGEIFGITGPNGAGKTTTVECVEGLRTPDGGCIRVLGLDPRTEHAELRRRLGVQLQESQLPER